MANHKELEALEARLKKLETTVADTIQKWNTPSTATMHDVFSDHFIQEYTDYPNFQSYMQAGGFTVETTKQLLALPEEALDDWVASTTRFSSWREFLREASFVYAMRDIGFRL